MWADRGAWNIIAFLLIVGLIAVVTVPLGLIAWLLYVIFT